MRYAVVFATLVQQHPPEILTAIAYDASLKLLKLLIKHPSLLQLEKGVRNSPINNHNVKIERKEEPSIQRISAYIYAAQRSALTHEANASSV